MCVAIDCKPRNACKIQNACDRECGVVIRLKLVKTSVADSLDPSMQLDLNHGTKVSAHKVPQSEFQQFAKSAFSNSLKAFVSNVPAELHMTFA